ncbi:MAG: SDR family oxidoreductase [Candidatus Eremiobacteraeota bacterium]|nr:SDR family oxidoreductase [Candidatus Eremiobacteraeota bacterium]
METQIELGTVLISGGASGLGAAIADAVAAHGGTPVVFDLQQNGRSHSFQRVDISDRNEVESALAAVRERHGKIHAVVANAGTDACGPFERVSAEAWERVINVNLIGTASLVRAALDDLLETRGKVITVASTLGFRVFPDATAYCASKFGIVGFTRALASEFAGRIGVTLLIPGGMQTAFFDGREEKYRPGPDASLNKPADVANAVIFALSQPPGCEVRELLITPSKETSWP